MLSTTESISFSKYGKTFQEKLAFLILDDRVFADRMMEVLNATKCVDCKEKEKLNLS